MRLDRLVAAAGFSLALLASAPIRAGDINTLSEQERADGWQLLFDGKSLAGWHSYGQKQPGKDWQVRDGAIVVEHGRHADPDDVADLMTDAEYGDFDLKLEWRMSPCADSGVFFHTVESSQYKYPWQTAPEMQIADLACTEPDSRVLNERSGDLFDLISSDVEWVREAGNWNQFEIIVKQGHLQFFQNGHKVVDAQIGDARWNELVGKSKFASMPGFARAGRGRIGLQGNEDKGRGPIQLAFRNIKLRPLGGL